MPAQTLRELCLWVRDVYAMEVGTTTMHKTLGRFGVTQKKITLHAAEQARPMSHKPAKTGQPHNHGCLLLG